MERSEFNQRILNAMPAILINHIAKTMITKNTRDEGQFKEYIRNFTLSADFELTGNTPLHTKNLRLASHVKARKLVDWLIKEMRDTRRCILLLIEWTLELHDAGAINIFESKCHKDILSLRDSIEVMVEKYDLQKQQESTDRKMIKFHNLAIKLGVV